MTTNIKTVNTLQDDRGEVVQNPIVVAPATAVLQQRQPANDVVEIDLLELMYLLWDKIIFIIIAFIIGAAGAFLYTKYMVTPLYSATARMYIMSSSSNSVVNLSDLQISNNLRSDYRVLLTSRPILEKVITSLDLPYNYGQLSGMVNISNPSDTRILDVKVTTPNPQQSADIANELVKQGQKDLPVIMKTEEPSIFENATVPLSKSSPSFTRNIAIGGLAVAMLYCAIVIFLHITNDTITTPDDVFRVLGVQPLATIPEGDLSDYNKHAKKKKKKRK